MSGRIGALLKKVEELRNGVIRLSSRGKGDKEEKGEQKPENDAKELESKIDGFCDQVSLFWREHLFLMANYRMDVAAK